MEESKRERVGGGKEVLLPSLPNPTLSPFFLAYFPLHFPNLQVNYVPSLISNFLWYIFNLRVEHFWHFVIDQQEQIW